MRSLCFLYALAWPDAELGAAGREPVPEGRFPVTLQVGPPHDRAAQDAQLVRRIAAGDRESLAELYDRFAAPLYGTALRILRDPAEAQDVVHDTFVTLWDKAGSYDEQRGTAFAWAVALVRHRAIDRLRTATRRSNLLAEFAPENGGLSDAASADVSAALSDEAQRLRTAVARLPDDQKRAVELAFFGGLTQQQIAQAIQQPLGTVKARIRRALLKLRESLAPRP